MDLQYTLVSDKLTIARSDGVRQPVIKGQKLYNTVFSGVKLLEEEVKAWLSSCAETRPENKPLLKVSDLTKESRQSIQHKHRLDPLPAGWYYNGTQYVCMDGERSSTHP